VGTREYLTFSATVWVAGTSPLVVEGYAPAGTMVWDTRDGHQHWHLADFARYRLLDSAQQVALVSQKAGFCLASTDAVDFTVARANWRPAGTSLHGACGDITSLAVREVLEIGSGDTYTQQLPGQSFDVTDLAAGTYLVEVTANPDHRLRESDTGNNVSIRRVILGGGPGAHVLEVPPYGAVDG
jgi:Lysyl oxidase